MHIRLGGHIQINWPIFEALTFCLRRLAAERGIPQFSLLWYSSSLLSRYSIFERISLNDEEGKQEEKLEFTPEGESIGYISLEEARIQVMELARDDAGFYGSTYHKFDLVHELFSIEEGEDHYEIRLSFRPAGRYTGQPGVEQFIIDKIGAIRIRQILDEPSDLAGGRKKNYHSLGDRCGIDRNGWRCRIRRIRRFKI